MVVTNAFGNVSFTISLGGVSVDSYISVTATSPGNDTSEFSRAVRADSDLDGLPDAFEIDHGFDPGDPSDGSADSDGDGNSNRDEYITGTDPRDPASGFHLTPVGFREAGFVISFSTVPGRRYQVEYTEDLAGGVWTILAGDIEGTGDIVEVIDPDAVGRPARLYRARVTL